ncbi:hypothetical protein OS493_022366 [Desmophyllum pertusum]|uniref:Phosphatidic acid phosphatase type 2/haloperoxidase domain-containing protein n=1 Tax=Desmophyllum pertusum TaxID=174260 RepID=A0A9X0D813_9CNID|nr:hypothetical protein OS493_022366 [Desmophyllum pertusum]
MGMFTMDIPHTTIMFTRILRITSTIAMDLSNLSHSTSPNHQAKKNPSSYTNSTAFFHALFVFGSTLGYESFYITFFPFVFWNIDEYLARRTVIMWAVIMYIGQCAKDVIQWPRPPCPPVISVEKRFQVEYGMPSTHAMVGTLIPFCLVYFTYDRYQYPLYVGVIFGVCWCALVTTSRLYMGMHTVQDLLVGVAFAVLLLVTVIPLLDVSIDRWVFTSPNTPIFLIIVPIAMIILYPSPPTYTQTRSDTADILFGSCGALLGSWGRFYFQGLPDPYLGAPFPIRIPGQKKLIQMLCKFVFGVTVLLPTRAVLKSTVHIVVPWLLAETDPKKKKSVSEFPHRFLTYSVLGFITAYLIPQIFAYFGV